MLDVLYTRAGLLVFAAALLVRFAFLQAVPQDDYLIKKWGAGQYYDAYDYDQLALNLVLHKTYGYSERASSYRPPAYPFFLAACYKVFGHQLSTVRFVQIVLGSIICVLLFRMGLMLFGNPAAFLVGLVGAVYPYFIFFNLQILSETLCMFFLVAAGWALLYHRQKNEWGWLALAGGCWALGALTRPLLLPLAAVPLVWLVWLYRPAWQRSCLNSGLFALGLVLFIAPWTIRNYTVHHALVPISTNGGFNFYLGNAGYAAWAGKNTDAQAMPDAGILTDTEMERSRIPVSEIAAEHAAYRAGLDFVREHPAQFVRQYLVKLYDYWHFWLSAGHSLPARLISLLGYGGILAGGILGMYWYRNPAFPGVAALFAGAALFSSLIYGLFLANIRMRVPMVDPWLILFCVYGWKRIGEKIHHRGTEK
jgi:4-amino-4-deoxy-L-arabinose transferase-like glycosyltransferase